MNDADKSEDAAGVLAHDQSYGSSLGDRDRPPDDESSG